MAWFYSFFILGGLETTIQIPLLRGWWAVVRGSVELNQLIIGDAAVRVALGKDPGLARFFLTFSGGVVFNTAEAGPSVGAGIEYRWQ